MLLKSVLNNFSLAFPLPFFVEAVPLEFLESRWVTMSVLSSIQKESLSGPSNFH